METQLIQRWLDIARWAPSGGNAQPWAATIHASPVPRLSLSIDESYAAYPSQMDLDGSMSIIALGAFVETLAQVAELDGYRIESLLVESPISFFSTSIEIKFTRKATWQVDPESAALKILTIKTRHTNRNPYRRAPLPVSFLEWMRHQAEAYGLHLGAIDENRHKLIGQLSLFEEIRWENAKLLESLLQEITLKAEHSTTGIPITHLGVAWNEQMILSMLKRHPNLRTLLRVGISKIIAKQSIQKPLTESGLFIYLSGKKANVESFFQMGRLVQSIWLQAHRGGISFQPFAGHLIAYHWLRDKRSYHLSNKHQEHVLRVKEMYWRDWKIDLRLPLFGFRVGLPIEVGHESPRKPLSEFLLSHPQDTSIAVGL